MDKETYHKITSKKEFSKLPQIDVEKCWKVFEKRQTLEEEKIRLTRDILRRVFSVFTSNKLLTLKKKDPEWVLNKHLSTKERLSSYKEVYSQILKNLKSPITVFDLGCGINGFSYDFFPKPLNYIGFESLGQLVDLQNNYFLRKKIKNAKTVHLSLFELDKIKKFIQSEKGNKILFLFKVIDSLEMVEKNFSKKLLVELMPFVGWGVVSFATRSLVKKTKFKATRNWIYYFIKENFEILKDFEVVNERYILFKNK